jgi:hypothetical protein
VVIFVGGVFFLQMTIYILFVIKKKSLKKKIQVINPNKLTMRGIGFGPTNILLSRSQARILSREDSTGRNHNVQCLSITLSSNTKK